MYKEHVSTKTVDAQFIYSQCISIYKRSSSGEILQDTERMHNNFHIKEINWGIKLLFHFLLVLRAQGNVVL